MPSPALLREADTKLQAAIGPKRCQMSEVGQDEGGPHYFGASLLPPLAFHVAPGELRAQAWRSAPALGQANAPDLDGSPGSYPGHLTGVGHRHRRRNAWPRHRSRSRPLRPRAK